MSTAVLAGADLAQWIASTEDDYFIKAVQAATQLKYLRESRVQLRRQLQKVLSVTLLP